MDILSQDWRQSHTPEVKIFPTKDELLNALAMNFLDLAQACQENRGAFSVILGGGRTPQWLNPLIVQEAATWRGSKVIDWDQVFIFFSDERCVPPDDLDSNYKMILDTLVQPLNIPAAHVYRIQGEMEPFAAAVEYQRKLLEYSGGLGIPVIDLALLGLGSDGHTASLFPGSNALKEFKNFAVSAGTGPEGLPRVTLTYPVLNAVQNSWLMAAGSEKAPVIHQLLEGEYNPVLYPAQAIFPAHGRLIYWLDSPAGNG